MKRPFSARNKRRAAGITYPMFYKHQAGNHAKVTGPKKWLKAWWTEGVLQTSMVESEIGTHEIFSEKGGWKKIEEAEWIDLHGLAAAARNSKDGKPLKFLAQMPDGRNAYVYEDPWDLSGGRYEAFQAALIEVDLRLDQKSLLDALHNAQETLKGDKIDIGATYSVLEDLKQRVQLTFNVNAAKRLASVMILVDGEDPDTYSFKLNDDKAKLWAGNDGDFFFKTPFRDFFPSTIESSADLAKFLKEQEVVMRLIEQRLLKSIPQLTQPSSPSKPTQKQQE